MTEKNQKAVFIPKKLKIGFVDREKSELGRLAFVTYFDDKGVHRQEKSFNNWRDHKIETLEWTNEPRKGFRIASSIKRTPCSFGERTEKIRIIDPRGAEFEISVENHIFILDHADIINQEITSELIYAWDKAELILLPTNSDFYKENIKVKNEEKITAKNLKVGSSYIIGNPNDTAIYLGEFYWINLLGDCSYKPSIDELIKAYKNKDQFTKQGIDVKKYSDSLKKQHLFIVKKRFTRLTRRNNTGYVIRKLTIANIKRLKEEYSEISEQQIKEINELWNLSKTKPTENIKNEELKINSYYYEKVDGLEFYTRYSSRYLSYGGRLCKTCETECVDPKSKKLYVKVLYSEKMKSEKDEPVIIALEAQNRKIKKFFNVKKLCEKDNVFVNNGKTVYTDVKYLVFNGVEMPVKTEDCEC